MDGGKSALLGCVVVVECCVELCKKGQSITVYLFVDSYRTCDIAVHQTVWCRKVGCANSGRFLVEAFT